MSNATQDGARLLDSVMGEGEAEVWTNLCMGNGGVVCCTPWLFFLGYPKEEDERCLYVAFLYGDLQAVAEFSMNILNSGQFDRVEFRKSFTKRGEAAERPLVYDRRLVERMYRMAQRKKA